MIGVYKLTRDTLIQSYTFVFNMKIGEEIRVIQEDDQGYLLLSLGKGAYIWESKDFIDVNTELVTAGIQLEMFDEYKVIES